MTSPTVSRQKDGEVAEDDVSKKTAAATTGSPDATPTVSETREGQAFGLLLRECLSLIESSVVTKDGRLIARMLRRISSLRRLFHSKVYVSFVTAILTSAGRPRGVMLTDIFTTVTLPKVESKNDDVEMMSASNNTSKAAGEEAREVWAYENVKEFTQSVEEIDLFLSTLALIVLVDAQQIVTANTIADSLVSQLSAFPQPTRHEDLILAKVVFWVGRVYELKDRLSHLRGFFMAMYRTSVLHHGIATQAVALNMLLRSFLQNELYDQAVQLLEKSPYPESLRSNAQHARYLYYLARINAVRLNYSEAHSKITLALRKAPQENSTIGRGFRLTANKLNIIIQLLMGDIPDRRLFNQKDIRQSLLPYSEIVQAVRSGDLALFKTVSEQHESRFRKDRNIILVQRLRYNVIRAGLRKITASYSQISIEDTTALLGLDSTDDTKCIVAKAIADGVIDATIDVASQTVQSKNSAEAQSVVEPRKAFHSRISFCLQLYNDALKAMQYPEPESESRIEEAEARRKEHQEQLARAEKDEFEGGDGADLL